jgi:hypothetical protein
MKPHRREPLEEEEDADEAVDDDDEEREAGGVAVGSTDSDSGGGAGDGDLQWARNGESERDFRCTDRLRKRPRSPASAA